MRIVLLYICPKTPPMPLDITTNPILLPPPILKCTFYYLCILFNHLCVKHRLAVYLIRFVDFQLIISRPHAKEIHRVKEIQSPYQLQGHIPPRKSRKVPRNSLNLPPRSCSYRRLYRRYLHTIQEDAPVLPNNAQLMLTTTQSSLHGSPRGVVVMSIHDIPTNQPSLQTPPPIQWTSPPPKPQSPRRSSTKLFMSKVKHAISTTFLHNKQPTL